MEPALVDLNNVQVIRGDNVALDDFSLRINSGEHVAILGPNGCGKSTLIKTITRECYPMIRDGSSMTILGQSRWNVFELRSVLGIVSNDLMTDVTGETSGREVVLSGFFSSTKIFDHLTVEESHRERADAVLERIGVPHLADRPVAGNVLGRSQAHPDRACPGPQSAHAAIRRAQQQPGRFRATRLAGNHARAGAIRHWHRSGDAPSLRRNSGDRSRGLNEKRKNSGGRAENRFAESRRNLTLVRTCASILRSGTATTICGD